MKEFREPVISVIIKGLGWLYFDRRNLDPEEGDVIMFTDYDSQILAMAFESFRYEYKKSVIGGPPVWVYRLPGGDVVNIRFELLLEEPPDSKIVEEFLIFDQDNNICEIQRTFSALRLDNTDICFFQEPCCIITAIVEFIKIAKPYWAFYDYRGGTSIEITFIGITDPFECLEDHLLMFAWIIDQVYKQYQNLSAIAKLN